MKKNSEKWHNICALAQNPMKNMKYRAINREVERQSEKLCRLFSFLFCSHLLLFLLLPQCKCLFRFRLQDFSYFFFFFIFTLQLPFSISIGVYCRFPVRCSSLICIKRLDFLRKIEKETIRPLKWAWACELRKAEKKMKFPHKMFMFMIIVMVPLVFMHTWKMEWDAFNNICICNGPNVYFRQCVKKKHWIVISGSMASIFRQKLPKMKRGKNVKDSGMKKGTVNELGYELTFFFFLRNCHQGTNCFIFEANFQFWATKWNKMKWNERRRNKRYKMSFIGSCATHGIECHWTYCNKRTNKTKQLWQNW